jgi:UDP-glucose 4-epimerase
MLLGEKDFARRRINLGIGIGTRVLQIVGAVERALDHPQALEFGRRRTDDPPALVASATKAWKPTWLEVKALSRIDVIVETVLNWIRSTVTSMHRIPYP